MMRWVALIVIVGLLGLGYYAYQAGDRVVLGMAGDSVVSLVSISLALLLAVGVGLNMRRGNHRASYIIAGIIFWTAALFLLVVGYEYFAK